MILFPLFGFPRNTFCSLILVCLLLAEACRLFYVQDFIQQYNFEVRTSLPVVKSHRLFWLFSRISGGGRKKDYFLKKETGRVEGTEGKKELEKC